MRKHDRALELADTSASRKAATCPNSHSKFGAHCRKSYIVNRNDARHCHRNRPAAAEAGFDAFWVGGSVRDFLLGREPDDYDVATSALPEEIEKIFKNTIAVGRKFGVIVVIEEGHQFQVATFRAEADYQDGRHPEHVQFGDARADAERRDFTVNGLFFDPVHKQLHDWVGGEKDLKAKIIRTIGSPNERFAEDHLRLLRAVRLAARLGFEIEPETFLAIQAQAEKIKVISAERIRDELVKLFAPGELSVDEKENGARGAMRPTSKAARGLLLLHEEVDCSNTFCRKSPQQLIASSRRIITRKAASLTILF